MKIRLISRSVITVLSCCAITLLGGWIGESASSSAVLKGPHVSHSGTADSVFPVVKWDSAGWTGRVVVGEYLTGLFCGLCQPHEKEFDSLIKRYPSTAFIALAYHGPLHPPIANPAQNFWFSPTGMYYWYSDGTNADIPSVFPMEKNWDNWINGHATGEGDIDKQYKNMVEAIDADLHKAPEAVLQVEATPHGGTIVAKVQVKSLSPPHSDVFVRILVVEDTVNLEITNPSFPIYGDGEEKGLQHYMVVRAVNHDEKDPVKYPLGSLLHGTGTVTYTFDMAEFQKQKLYYRRLALGEVRPKSLKDTVAVNNTKILAVHDVKGSGIARYSGKKNWMMDPTRLHLVAFVQDAHTGNVLQAQMVAVNTGPHGKLLKLPDSPRGLKKFSAYRNGKEIF